MSKYPIQTIPRRATIAKRSVVTIRRDAAKGGSSNPTYSEVVHQDILAEVLDVGGMESLRGKQLESQTQFVVSIGFVVDAEYAAANSNADLRTLEATGIGSNTEVEVVSGEFAGQRIYPHHVQLENDHGRPMALQLHCKVNERTEFYG